jgi:methylmalonyl-CoA mutase cobalamin-binding domain/chain
MAEPDAVKREVEKALSLGADPREVLDAMVEALEEVGGRYERGEAFLSELLMAGLLATEVVNTLKPHWRGRDAVGLKVVMGTVKGDVHDIGKNIVIMMLQAAGFEVVDLGVDVSAERFAEAVEKETPAVLGLSALLSSTVPEMKNVIDLLKKRGLRSRVKVVVGGRPVDEAVAREMGADGYGVNAVEAVKVVKRLTSR